MERVFLGLGSNLGNREGNLLSAARMLGREGRVVRVSSLWRSAAVVVEGDAAGPDFLNAACEIETELPPEELLRFVKTIEWEIGRRPTGRWAPRPIDIDVLLYGDQVIETAELVVPHPQMLERNFVLAPLAEIGVDVVHPVAGRRISEVATEVGREGLEVVRVREWALVREGD